MKKYRIEIKWALLFFVIALLWMVFEKLMGWHGDKIADHYLYTNIFMIPAIILYVQALLDKRDNYLGGHMTWLQGFISGSVISIIVAILSPLSQWITHSYISPEYFPNVIAYAVESEELTQEAAEKYFNLISYMGQSALGALGMGLITAAIVSLFVKRN